MYNIQACLSGWQIPTSTASSIKATCHGTLVCCQRLLASKAFSMSVSGAERHRKGGLQAAIPAQQIVRLQQVLCLVAGSLSRSSSLRQQGRAVLIHKGPCRHLPLPLLGTPSKPQDYLMPQLASMTSMMQAASPPKVLHLLLLLMCCQGLLLLTHRQVV